VTLLGSQPVTGALARDDAQIEQTRTVQAQLDRDTAQLAQQITPIRQAVAAQAAAVQPNLRSAASLPPVRPFHAPDATHEVPVVLPPNFAQQHPVVLANLLHGVIGDAAHLRIVQAAAANLDAGRAALREELVQLNARVAQSGDAVALGYLRQAAQAPAQAIASYYAAGYRALRLGSGAAHGGGPLQLVRSQLTPAAPNVAPEPAAAAPTSSTHPTRARPSTELTLYHSSNNAESYAIVKRIIATGNVVLMRALHHAMEQAISHRASPNGSDHVHCVAENSSFDLTLAFAQSNSLLPLLQQQATARTVEAQTDQRIEQGPFAAAFNREFATILPALRQAGSTPSADTGSAFTDAELNLLLSAQQRQTLLQYTATHVIPDRLFDGDDHSGMTAQQRIVLSAHILTHGTYAPGSFSQGMHARMCGNWVQLAQIYAGVARENSAGIGTQFDHNGQLALGAGRLQQVYSGEQQPLAAEARTGHREHTQVGMNFDDYQTLRPGDWLYLYTNTDTAGGNHSVIFSHWLGPATATSTNVRYRAAVIFGQPSPDRGGAETHYLLGEAYVAGPNGEQIYPITQVQRFEDVRPPETVDDVVAHELGGGNVVAPNRDLSPNQELIRRMERRFHGGLDLQRLIAALRQRNDQLLNDLAAMENVHGTVASPGQMELLRATNRETDIDTLVRLNERLNMRVRNGTALAAAEQTQTERIDPRHDAQAEEVAAQHAELQHQIDAIEPELERARQVAGPLARVRELHQQQMRAEHNIRDARRQRTHYRRGTPGWERTTTQIATATTRLTAIDAEMEQAQAELAHVQKIEEAGRVTTRLSRNLSAHARLGQLLERQRILRRQIIDLEADAGYHMAHPGSRSAFRGIVEGHGPEHATGNLAAVTPALTWSELIIEGASATVTEPPRQAGRHRGGRAHGSRRGH